VNLVAVQHDIVWENKRANHEKVRALLEGATTAGDLVVLPEMFATGFSMNVAAICEGAQRVSELFLAQLAKDLGICIVGGVVNVASDGRGRNEALAVGSDGRQLSRYAKVHPFTLGREAEHFVGGHEIAIFTWKDAVVAPFVCYDLRFPEIFRHAVRRGAEVMVVIANWPRIRIQQWVTLLQARAIENQAYVVGVNRIGHDPNTTYNGRSVIIDPMGTTLADAGDREQVITAECDLNGLRQWREQLPALRDMRREFLR
jgi:omega-amidase